MPDYLKLRKALNKQIRDASLQMNGHHLNLVILDNDGNEQIICAEIFLHQSTRQKYEGGERCIFAYAIVQQSTHFNYKPGDVIDVIAMLRMLKRIGEMFPQLSVEGLKKLKQNATDRSGEMHTDKGPGRQGIDARHEPSENPAESEGTSGIVTGNKDTKRGGSCDHNHVRYHHRLAEERLPPGVAGRMRGEELANHAKHGHIRP